MKKRFFTEQLIIWQKQEGRHHLPWQVSDPYWVWLSEIMLQQTQVKTVLDYFPRFIRTFPTVQDLANASEDEVLSLWAGLGYYSRARNLHFASKQIINDFNGKFPENRRSLEQLKGVGRSTASAICAFAFQRREAILDGNVKRVLTRVFNLEGAIDDKKFESQLWTFAEALLPENPSDMPSYTQGLMDLGATVCTPKKPNCLFCPMRTICEALRLNKITQLPQKKKALPVPEKTLYWLILKDKNQGLYLEKRPTKGIWGGLYCVPCFDDLDQLSAFIANLGLNFAHLNEKSAFFHRLTHRLLQIQVYELNSEKALPNSYTDWQALGLPKPLKDYLENDSLNNLPTAPID